MKRGLEPLITAWEGARTHKLRSSLTITGIVIGVAAVIALMSIGRGVQAQILSRIESLGSNLVFVMPGSATQEGVRGGAGTANTLTQEDATAISDQVADVAFVAPYSQSSAQLVVGSNNMRAQVLGVTPEYAQAYNLETTDGAFLSDYDYQSGARVAVIGSSVKDTLFGSDGSPVGQQIRMGNSVVTVMGVLASKGQGFGSTDDQILIPLTTFQQTMSRQLTATGQHLVSSIAVSLGDPKQSDTVVSEITSLLHTRHRIGSGATDDFNIRNMQDLVSTVSQTTNTMTLFLGLMAGIALLVGGIGVMNIMLVSVVERTREIGIRKALGARERDIWGQFLTESAFLSFSGGLIGIGVGWAVSRIVASRASIPTLVSPDIVILAVSVSIAIGLLFGFLPARRAARLNPIEALRYE